MAYNKYDKLEWTLIFATEFGKRFDAYTFEWAQFILMNRRNEYGTVRAAC